MFPFETPGSFAVRGRACVLVTAATLCLPLCIISPPFRDGKCGSIPQADPAIRENAQESKRCVGAVKVLEMRDTPSWKGGGGGLDTVGITSMKSGATIL